MVKMSKSRGLELNEEAELATFDEVSAELDGSAHKTTAPSFTASGNPCLQRQYLVTTMVYLAGHIVDRIQQIGHVDADQTVVLEDSLSSKYMGISAGVLRGCAITSGCS